MLQKHIAAKIDQGLAKLAEDQKAGIAPPPGEVSLAEIARRAGVSDSTILKLERIALAKVHAALIKEPHLLSMLKFKSLKKTS